MRHGVWLRCDEATDPADLIDQAIAAEEAGWDGVFVSDPFPFQEFPDPMVTLAGMAAKTDELTLGTWVVPLPRRQPAQFAMEVATLDRLADGRLLVGCGLGNNPDYPAFGTPYDPPKLANRFDEALEVITGLWTDAPLTYSGYHFTLDEAEVHPTPVQEPRVPLLMGAWWPNKKPFHRGARWDGIMPFMASLTADDIGPHGEEPTGSPEEEVREMLSYYHEIADDPGDILIPRVPTDDQRSFLKLCDDLGVTWVLTTNVVGPDATTELREGPPPGP